MKVLAGLILFACVYYVWTERCSTVSECTTTSCLSTAAHAHVQCVANHCTCSLDTQPCLSIADCNHGKCFDRDGHKTDWHCLDANCTCIRV